ncbi:hypothetical protein, partial [Streptomyces alkaliphilus]|uniref:hypothetical protein n=1 Tax=Streptomyces alkaliphilus TaxID=1472722 RepID=UPI00117CA7D3
MRATRTVFVSAAITAALAISAPAAQAQVPVSAEMPTSTFTSGDHHDRDHKHDGKWDKDRKDERKHDGWKGHKKPRGGVHAGGGALVAGVMASESGDKGYDKGHKHDGKWDKDRKDERKHDGWKGHKKPRGGVHAGGGALVAGVMASESGDKGYDKGHKHDGKWDKDRKDERKHDGWKGHKKPRGGVHAGGGALVAGVMASESGDKGYDKGHKHDGKWDKDRKDERKHDGWKGHKKPRGGVHAGGGALVAGVMASESGDKGYDRDHKHDGKWDKDRKDERKHDGWKGHKKPRGGVHAGGGALVAGVMASESGDKGYDR